MTLTFELDLNMVKVN